MRHALLFVLTAGCIQLPKPLSLIFHAHDVDVHMVDDRVLSDAVEPLPFEVKLYDERASWYLPAYLPTEPWGPILLADSVLRQDGEEALVSVAVSGLTWDAPAELSVTFALEAAEGRASAIAPRDTPVQPEACTVAVTPTTTDADHAADLQTCLQAWSDVNGAPAGLHLRVTATTSASDWAFAAHYTLATRQPTQAGCTGPQIVGHDAGELPRVVELTGAELWGEARAGASAISVVTWENTFLGDGWAPSAGGVSTTTVPAGERRSLEAQTFPADWGEQSLIALDDADGFLDACLVVVHDGAVSDAQVELTATLTLDP